MPTDPLTQLRQLEQAATPAPWQWGDPWNNSRWARHVNAQNAARRPLDHMHEECLFTDDAVVLESYGGWDGESHLGIRPEDIALLAAMRNALPALLNIAEALADIADPNSKWDDLDPYDGLHESSVRDFARQALGQLNTET